MCQIKLITKNLFIIILIYVKNSKVTRVVLDNNTTVTSNTVITETVLCVECNLNKYFNLFLQ